eukprot:scaffold24087_cov49-Cyclotella_meneghiniana.AAC.2
MAVLRLLPQKSKLNFRRRLSQQLVQPCRGTLAKNSKANRKTVTLPSLRTTELKICRRQNQIKGRSIRPGKNLELQSIEARSLTFLVHHSQFSFISSFESSLNRLERIFGTRSIRSVDKLHQLLECHRSHKATTARATNHNAHVQFKTSSQRDGKKTSQQQQRQHSYEQSIPKNNRQFINEHIIISMAYGHRSPNPKTLLLERPNTRGTVEETTRTRLPLRTEGDGEEGGGIEVFF